MIDPGTILSVLVTLSLSGIGGLAWLFKLHGDVRVLRERVNSEVEMRKAIQSRIEGFEQRIWDKLDEISTQLARKADR